MRNEYRPNELRLLAWHKLLGASDEECVRQLDGRHSEGSVHMAWLNIQGQAHASRDMVGVGEELDRIAPGWRELARETANLTG